VEILTSPNTNIIIPPARRSVLHRQVIT